LIKSRVAAGVPQLTGREHDLAVAEWAEVLCLIPREQLASVIRYAKANRERKSAGFPITPDEVLVAYKEMCAPKFLSTADAWNLAYTQARATYAAVKARIASELEANPEGVFISVDYSASLQAQRAEKPMPTELLQHPLLVKVLEMYDWDNFCYTPQKYQERFVFDYKAEVEQAFKAWSDSFSRNL
jgi:phage pi2 protein 07